MLDLGRRAKSSDARVEEYRCVLKTVWRRNELESLSG